MDSSDRGKGVFGENRALAPLFAPVPHALSWDGTQASVVRSRRLITLTERRL